MEDYNYLRGPVVLALVTVSLLWPYVSSWSTTFLLQLSTAGFGLFLCLVDFIRLSRAGLRTHLSRLLNIVVLDDVLKFLFDPDYGVISCSIAFFVGASSMYGLRMDEHQRTKLVQASLLTTYDETESILFQPGGCKALLPQGVQNWIDEVEIEDKPNLSSYDETIVDFNPDKAMVDRVEVESDSSTSDCHHLNEKQCDINIRQSTTRADASSTAATKDRNVFEATNSRNFIPSEAKQPTRNLNVAPADPMIVLLKIVRDMALEQFKPYFAAIPESTPEIMGAIALAALSAQTVLRFRSKPTMLSTASSIVLTSLATGSFSTILVRHALLGTIKDGQTLQLVCKEILFRMWSRLKNAALKNRRLRNTLALGILSFLGKSQLQHSGQTKSTIRKGVGPC